MYNPHDYYNKLAKTKGYKARSAFKLEEIQKKFNIFDKKTKTILDIGCSPGSWIQYVAGKLEKLGNKYKIIGFDTKETKINFPNIKTYIQDITEYQKIEKILNENDINKNQINVIMSDMAPNTIGQKDIDAIRLFSLLEESFPIYENYLNPQGKFIIKVFMGTGFESFLDKLKKKYGKKNIKIFKPDASRKSSKETYIIKAK